MITIKGNHYTLGAFLRAGSSVLYYELLRPIAWLPSRLLFGNFIGYRNNVVPLVQVGLQRKRAPQARADDRAVQDARTLRENGFVLLPRRVAYAAPESGRALEAIVRKCNELMNGYDSILTRVKGTILNIYRPLEKIPELKYLITDDIDRTLRAYYGSSYRIKSVQVWRNTHVPHADPMRDAGIANAFHNDGSPRTDLRLFVLLNDAVTRETGSLRFHDKAASRRIAMQLGYFSRSRQTRRVKEMLLDPATLRHFEGNVGDACLINTQECIHAATIPRAGSFRDVVQFEITPSLDRVAKDDIYSEMPEDPQANPTQLPFRTR